MRKIAVGFIIAAFAIVISGCDFNLFSELDKIDVPSRQALLDKASNNGSDFVNDVQDYIDSGSITEENADDVVDALKTVYDAPPDTETGQKAAVLAGEISIDSDPGTKEVVDSVISTVMDALNAGGEVDPEDLISDIFPSDLSQAGLTEILDNLAQAADAYNDFGSDTAGADEWMSGGEIGDVAQYAVVSMVITDIREQLGTSADSDLYDLITGNTTSLPSFDDPFDTTDGATTGYETSLQNILTLSGLDL